MDDEQSEQATQPKISVVDMVLVGLFLAMLDAIDLVPFAGDLTDVFAAPLVFYYFIKNINGVAYIVSLVLDAIPGIQEVPTRSIVWWGTVIVDHMAPKKLEQTLEKAGEIAQAGEGGGAAEGAEATAGTVAEETVAAGNAAAETEMAATETGVQNAADEAAATEHAPADEMTPKEERNPMENLQEELEEPGPGEDAVPEESKEETPEAEDESSNKGRTIIKDRAKRVIDIRSRMQSALGRNQDPGENEEDEGDEAGEDEDENRLAKAA